MKIKIKVVKVHNIRSDIRKHSNKSEVTKQHPNSKILFFSLQGTTGVCRLGSSLQRSMKYKLKCENIEPSREEVKREARKGVLELII